MTLFSTKVPSLLLHHGGSGSHRDPKGIPKGLRPSDWSTVGPFQGSLKPKADPSWGKSGKLGLKSREFQELKFCSLNCLSFCLLLFDLFYVVFAFKTCKEDQGRLARKEDPSWGKRGKLGLSSRDY